MRRGGGWIGACSPRAGGSPSHVACSEVGADGKSELTRAQCPVWAPCPPTRHSMACLRHPRVSHETVYVGSCVLLFLTVKIKIFL